MISSWAMLPGFIAWISEDARLTCHEERLKERGMRPQKRKSPLLAG